MLGSGRFPERICLRWSFSLGWKVNLGGATFILEYQNLDYKIRDKGNTILNGRKLLIPLPKMAI